MLSGKVPWLMCPSCDWENNKRARRQKVVTEAQTNERANGNAKRTHEASAKRGKRYPVDWRRCDDDAWLNTYYKVRQLITKEAVKLYSRITLLLRQREIYCCIQARKSFVTYRTRTSNRYQIAVAKRWPFPFFWWIYSSSIDWKAR